MEADWPPTVDTRPLRVGSGLAAVGLVAFTATFWTVGATMLLLDPLPGLLVGAWAGYVIRWAARPA